MAILDQLAQPARPGLLDQLAQLAPRGQLARQAQLVLPAPPARLARLVRLVQLARLALAEQRDLLAQPELLLMLKDQLVRLARKVSPVKEFCIRVRLRTLRLSLDTQVLTRAILVTLISL